LIDSSRPRPHGLDATSYMPMPAQWDGHVRARPAGDDSCDDAALLGAGGSRLGPYIQPRLATSYIRATRRLLTVV